MDASLKCISPDRSKDGKREVRAHCRKLRKIGQSAPRLASPASWSGFRSGTTIVVMVTATAPSVSSTARSEPVFMLAAVPLEGQ